MTIIDDSLRSLRNEPTLRDEPQLKNGDVTVAATPDTPKRIFLIQGDASSEGARKNPGLVLKEILALGASRLLIEIPNVGEGTSLIQFGFTGADQQPGFVPYRPYGQVDAIALNIPGHSGDWVQVGLRVFIPVEHSVEDFFDALRDSFVRLVDREDLREVDFNSRFDGNVAGELTTYAGSTRKFVRPDDLGLSLQVNWAQYTACHAVELTRIFQLGSQTAANGPRSSIATLVAGHQYFMGLDTYPRVVAEQYQKTVTAKL